MRCHYSFYSFITHTYNSDTCALLKKWFSLNLELIKSSLRVKFLSNCKRSNIVPKHFNIEYLTKFTFYHDKSKICWSKYTNMFINKLLNLEISDNIKKRHHLITSIYRCTRKIEEMLPWHICNKFFYTKGRSLRECYIREKKRLSTKFAHLITGGNPFTATKTIDNIKYYCSSNNHSTRYTFNKPLVAKTTHLIELKSTNFNDNSVRLLEPKEAWFVNASNTSVPDEVIGLLQLGEDFCLPSHNKDRDIVEYIKSIENNFNKLRLRNSNTFRNKLFPLIKSIKNNGTSKMDTEILAAVSITKRFVLNNPNVIFTRADKGNTVVALDRMEYINKMEINLADSNTYTRIQRNPINKITEHLKKTLKRWLQKEYITDHIHARLNSTNAILPRAYGLPKIHKADRPLRTIVSSIGSPLHNLSTYMLKILQKSFSTPDSSFKNSITLVKNLRKFTFPTNFV